MKTWLALLTVLTFAASCPADEIKIQRAEWNDLANALNILPFYFEIKSPAKAETVKLVLEVFRDGKKIETYYSPGFGGDKSKPIDLKSALFFDPKGDSPEYAATWTIRTEKGSAINRFTVPKSVFDFSKGASGWGSIGTTIVAPGKTWIARIVCQAKGTVSMSDTLEAMLAENKGAVVLAVFLECE